jgi:hypothetical protein
VPALAECLTLNKAEFIRIRFESRPGDLALGRLARSVVWINEAHPAYRRAVATRSEGYH